MDFTPVFVVGIIFFFAYRIVELFARRKERMAIIEKLRPDEDSNINASVNIESNGSFISIRFACLCLGIGAGIFICFLVMPQMPGENYYEYLRRFNTVCLGLVLLLGGTGLLISFFVERYLTIKDRDYKQSIIDKNLERKRAAEKEYDIISE